jgi:hypothetical protein
MINYIFRKPKFPVVYENNNNLIGGKTEKGFEIKVANLNIPSTSPPDVIDATGEVWFLSTDTLVLAPLTFKKRCTKKRLIDIYNNSNNSKENHIKYAEKSLSTKNFSRIIGDIVDLLEP